MTCRPFNAEEAKSIGFVNRVVASEDLEEETLKLAKAIKKRPQSVIQTTKKQVQSAAEDLASTQKEWVGEILISVAGLDQEAKESAQKYLRKRQ